jgi:hypothetical protein
VLKAVELPAGVTNLATSLANVDGKDFTHLEGSGDKHARASFREDGG